MVTSDVVFIVIPLVAGWASRTALVRAQGNQWFDQKFLPRFRPVSLVALLATFAVAITLFGPTSSAARATVVGVLVEVPVMLSVCRVCNASRAWYQRSQPIS